MLAVNRAKLAKKEDGGVPYQHPQRAWSTPTESIATTGRFAGLETCVCTSMNNTLISVSGQVLSGRCGHPATNTYSVRAFAENNF